MLRNAARLAASVASVVSMKITDSPGAILVMLLSATDGPKACELSSIAHALMVAVAVPMVVASNQSTRRAVGLFPLDQGAISVTISEGVPPVDGVIDKVKPTVASGVLPTVGSSTTMVTA